MVTQERKLIEHDGWKFDLCKKAIYEYDNDRTSTYFREYTDTNKEDKNTMDNIFEQEKLDNYRKAGLIHKLTRNVLRNKAKAGTSFTELVNEAEKCVKKFIKPEDNGGFAFPLGISINEVFAHDSAVPSDTRFLQKNDVVKIDLGIQINGCIIDSAFTMIVDGDDDFCEKYDPLIASTADATYTAIKMSGPDMELYELSEYIKEVIESYSLDDGTKITPVLGLGGHNILPYKVHGKKLILSRPHTSQKGQRMEEGEFYAIETFASTGDGQCAIKNLCNCSHFMLNEEEKYIKKIESTKNAVVNWANNVHNTLPFTQSWCTEIKNSKQLLDSAIKEKIVIAYPPLTDKSGTYTSQLEHTIHIGKNSLEIFTLGNDY